MYKGDTMLTPVTAWVHYADTSDSMTCVTDSDTMLTPVTRHFGPSADN